MTEKELMEGTINDLLENQKALNKKVDEMAKNQKATANKKAAPPKKLTRPTVEIDKKKYKFVFAKFRANVGGKFQVIIAEKITNDTVLLEDILENCPSVLDEVPAK